ncbi:FUBP3 [Symbiodinium natans]|uniref:FUBP3 protein n=1 Tax=Symbiodinium natans TaxID=878477 RepID=A0A812PGE0_9DINO|nr:FUBP3 [Symbiodinium natans]
MHSAQIKVPAQKIGVVVGRMGSMIKAIQEQHKVHISRSGETFTVLGQQQAVAMATMAIKELIGEKPGMHSAQIKVPAQKIGVVVGRMGSMIKAIQERRDVTVRRSHDLFTIVGEQQAVTMATEDIKELTGAIQVICVSWLQSGDCLPTLLTGKERVLLGVPQKLAPGQGQGSGQLMAYRNRASYSPSGIPFGYWGVD